MDATKEPDPLTVFGQVLTFADKLYESLEDLREIGGLGALPLRPVSVEKGRAALRSVHKAVAEELAGPAKPKPGPRPPAPPSREEPPPSDAPIRRVRRGVSP